jgi:diadenosine tetraphosphate (Ap4A) HIT family hydrolase
VQRLSPPGAKIAMARMLPMTTRMTHVLQLAGDEARALRHADVDAEHLLLGMLRETDGVAVNALRNLGVNLERLRAVVLAKLSGGGDDLAAIHPLSAACPMCAAIQTLGRTGSNWIADLSESHVVLGDNQGCRGWCVLLLKGHVEHLSQLDEDRQARLWRDVSRVAGAIRAVFPESGNGGPPRINYECLGNQVAHVHWHVIPRHADDPDPTKPVWGWPEERLRGTMTEAERGELVKQFRAKLAP